MEFYHSNKFQAYCNFQLITFKDCFNSASQISILVYQLLTYDNCTVEMYVFLTTYVQLSAMAALYSDISLFRDWLLKLGSNNPHFVDSL